MEFDLPRTAALFLGLVILGVGGLAGSGMMATRTVLMMVAPSMLGFGVICLALGVKHGEYRAGR
jgi:hypothetical protein